MDRPPSRIHPREGRAVPASVCRKRHGREDRRPRLSWQTGVQPAASRSGRPEARLPSQPGRLCSDPGRSGGAARDSRTGVPRLRSVAGDSLGGDGKLRVVAGDSLGGVGSQGNRIKTGRHFNFQRPTSNAQRPTPNAQGQNLNAKRCLLWKLGVERWKLGVGS